MIITERMTLGMKIVICIFLFMVLLNVVPPKKQLEKNPFIVAKGERPLIAAHRGGKNLNPENTFKAFDYAVNELDIDILELDLVMTKDKHLVAIHNLTINECSDAEAISGSTEDYYVGAHTLAELQELNFGYNFKDRNGNYPYRYALDDPERMTKINNEQLHIATIDDIFARYANTKLKFIVEIKDKNEIGFEAADQLNELLTVTYRENNLRERVIIGTFNGEVENYIVEKYPTLFRGGSVSSVTSFVITQMLGMNIFDKSNFMALQIPTSRSVKGITIKLDQRTYIKRAHLRGISVQYWSINDKEEMRRLLELGADVIMTDNPDIALELLIEMGYE